MFELFIPFFLLFLFILFLAIIWRINARKYITSGTVASAYDAWTQDKLLERLWGEHIHLGFYPPGNKNIDFREAKINFVHELVKWSGLDQLPKGSRILEPLGSLSKPLHFTNSWTNWTLAFLKSIPPPPEG